LQRTEQLYALTKRSLGATKALHAYKLHLGQVLEEYDLAQRQQNKID
jgi:transposase